MSLLVAVAALCASGLALLGLLGLGTGHRAADVPLAWLVGSGWFALAAFALRFLGGVSYTAPLAVAILAAPVAGLVAARASRRGVGNRPAAAPATGAPESPRWVPGPAWLFGPLAAYVAATAVAVALHGANTPTHTDDGFRVRAFAPMLAFDDAWGSAARAVLVMAGPVPTYVPSLGWRLWGTVDHLHVNGVVLVDLVALLALTVALASARGRPERGWAGAFALLSIPLFVYHCTSTYSDAVLAIHIGAAFVFLLEYGRRRDPGDAARALVLLVVASMVKREGAIVAAAVAAVLVAQVAWSGHRAGRSPLRRLGLLSLPFAVALVALVAAVGVADAFPLLKLAAERTSASAVPSSAPPSRALHSEALRVFVEALFSDGNAGLVFWALAAAVPLLLPDWRRRGLAWPLLAVGLLLVENAVTALWLVPAYTVDHATVHRALLPASVAAALWVAALMADPEPAADAGQISSPPNVV